MKKAILATKIGMTQIFAEDGELIPVTVLQAGPCEVTQVKTCLLYTSPSPRDRQKSRMPSSA